MFDIIIYFFRQNKLLFYFGLSVFGSLYSYLLWIYFFDSKPNILIVIIIFAIVWSILSRIKFSQNKEKYSYQMQKEQYALLRHQITQEYKLDIEDNIFSKVDLILSLIKEQFSRKELISIRTLKLINQSLGLYIENLKFKKQLFKADFMSKSIDKKEFYQNEIEKNRKQNSDIEESLENFIQELLSKNNNDTSIEYILNEFDDSIKLLSKIGQERR